MIIRYQFLKSNPYHTGTNKKRHEIWTSEGLPSEVPPFSLPFDCLDGAILALNTSYMGLGRTYEIAMQISKPGRNTQGKIYTLMIVPGDDPPQMIIT